MHDEHPFRASEPQFAPPPPKISWLAIVAFVLACLFFLPLLPLVGGILGIVATVRITRRRDQLTGLGLAVAAIPVGFVAFFVIQGMLAAIAIPSFIKYMRKAKASEARQSLRRVADGAREHYRAAHRFPAGDTGWVPATPCCQQPSSPRCTSAATIWSGAPWTGLRFALADRHYFQYRYRSSGEGQAARFVAEARADLDCDGRYSSYTLTGRVGADGEVRTTNRRLRRYE